MKNRFRPLLIPAGLALAAAGILPSPAARASDNANSYYQEAFVALKSGKIDEALERVDALLVKTPAEPRTLELKGRILIAKNRPAEAMEFLFQAVEKKPDLYSVHYYLGDAAFKLGHWAEASQYYQIFLSKVPDGKQGVLKLIYCYLCSRNLPGAAKWITALDPVDELHPYYYFARAALAFATQKPREYQEALQQARTIYGNDVYSEFEPDLQYTLKTIKNNSAELEGKAAAEPLPDNARKQETVPAKP